MRSTSLYEQWMRRLQLFLAAPTPANRPRRAARRLSARSPS